MRYSVTRDLLHHSVCNIAFTKIHKAVLKLYMPSYQLESSLFEENAGCYNLEYVSSQA